ncbi:MAG: hypothetical protein A2X25_03500 [Chloroflexi bacterium GWB2_49_20]|nr:MAG: hypothetical protein A2X25_03500 [Chloroflexi bacterium GWB2_49_20]OGN76653.1 MAG: hypothetical protein A2X26_10590 [Chloroflexi bacterium GWC2_49_37]OGN83613.1 MAG: hypothetical protein A2X27_01245 [Chloroflexi bacterium GWD2_49_16]
MKHGGSIPIVYAIVVRAVAALAVTYAVLDCAGFASENMPWKAKFPVLSRLLGNRVEVKA